MLNLTIIAVGGLKDAYYKQAAAEYLKRLKPFAKMTMAEITASPFHGKGDMARAKREEGEKVLKTLEKLTGATIFLLDERGKEFSSADFAEAIEKISGPLVFVLGGALGFDERVLGLPHQKLSLSRFTLPHHLARVVLLEQLYRAATINAGKEYHY